jgi:cellulose synthase/poly-beta-1,6-N-acetylglucosamine synthase-like glycosyltransferase
MKHPKEVCSEGPAEAPLVSAIVPAYNTSRWIERTLRSVTPQTYTNLVTRAAQ